MAKLIFGCGYVGRPVARLWREAGHAVFAVTRSKDRAAELASEGFQPLIGELLGEATIPLPQDITAVLFAVGYDRTSSAPIQDVYVNGLAQAIRSIPDSVERFIYISSTGVYGQVAGDEVDERSTCQPVRAGGKACLAAEQLLQNSRFASKAIILRMAGIYGPGRIPRSADPVAGWPIDAPARGWLNLIHVDDAAQIVLLAAAKAQPPQTYVVSDGNPVRRSDYYCELARLLRAPPPKFVPAPIDSPAMARAGSDKRVNPRKMFAELEPSLLYPNYRAGLAAIVSAGDAAR
jgi:nucleoside-diphosphate-sugar epimerase